MIYRYLAIFLNFQRSSSSAVDVALKSKYSEEHVKTFTLKKSAAYNIGLKVGRQEYFNPQKYGRMREETVFLSSAEHLRVESVIVEIPATVRLLFSKRSYEKAELCLFFNIGELRLREGGIVVIDSFPSDFLIESPKTLRIFDGLASFFSKQHALEPFLYHNGMLFLASRTFSETYVKLLRYSYAQGKQSKAELDAESQDRGFTLFGGRIFFFLQEENLYCSRDL